MCVADEGKRVRIQAISLMTTLICLARIDFKCLGNGDLCEEKDFFLFNLLNMLQ